MYPYIMANTSFPTSYVGHWTTCYNPEATAIWKCRVSEYPGLPFTFDSDLRTLSNSGTFILDTDTINYLSNITKVELLYGYEYFHVGDIFHYYQDLYNKRVQSQLSGDKANSFALKVVLNSLYGKFGQKDESRVITGYDRVLEESLIEQCVEYKTNEYFLFYNEEKHQKHAFPIISSLVTLRARLLLRTYSDLVPVVYCDTDSLHVPIQYELPTSTDLGALKLEFSGEGIYIGKKLYSLEEKLVHKGVRKGSIQKDDYFKMLNGEPVTANFIGFPTVRDILQLGKKPGILLDKSRTIGITCEL